MTERAYDSWYEKTVWHKDKKMIKCHWCKQEFDHELVTTVRYADGTEKEVDWPRCPGCKGS